MEEATKYLTYSDFNNFNSDISEEEFKRLLPKAIRQLQGLTNYFYPRMADFTDELNSEFKSFKWRAETYQQALCLTIEFMHDNNVTTSSEANSSATPSFTIGHTHVEGTSVKSAVSKALGFLVPNEAVNLLAPYGFLYRGVSAW